MIYLLDTNVISEITKKNPNDNVLLWLQSRDTIHFSLSVLTLGEIRKGIEKLGDPLKKQQIAKWLEIDLARQFNGRIIEINQSIAEKWGYISSICDIPAVDGLIAASAIINNQKLVTRNTKDFKSVIGLETINPWQL